MKHNQASSFRSSLVCDLFNKMLVLLKRFVPKEIKIVKKEKNPLSYNSLDHVKSELSFVSLLTLKEI